MKWNLQPDLVRLLNVAEDWGSVVKTLSGPLMARGFVRPSFADAVMAREREYPTGLETGGINVAVPHADAVHVIATSLCVGVLRRPVKFRRMDDPTRSTDVSVVFLLAIAEPEQHVDGLRSVMEVVHDQDALEKTVCSRTAEEAFRVLSERLL